ncbi:hypothetical protein AC477_01440 [miscellaneous Crenarchaeota group-1 archaeon SG8-32-1]|uniref:Uncharacterized protein n=1 Tax=miscellaneous Crenarchaeota group-1 archaeon SG8-32-1 TaxID=1685124 RepID=A0A0M0BY47_9ARCH|nr:MAG: hypothetical protein AC477_01440 [miscellaneous Crenarchaeota group-1 archaeon SG8-32-1]
MYTRKEIEKKLKNLRKRTKQLETFLEQASPTQVATFQVERWNSERSCTIVKINSLESRLERGEYKN